MISSSTNLLNHLQIIFCILTSEFMLFIASERIHVFPKSLQMFSSRSLVKANFSEMIEKPPSCPLFDCSVDCSDDPRCTAADKNTATGICRFTYCGRVEMTYNSSAEVWVKSMISLLFNKI